MEIPADRSLGWAIERVLAPVMWTELSLEVLVLLVESEIEDIDESVGNNFELESGNEDSTAVEDASDVWKPAVACPDLARVTNFVSLRWSLVKYIDVVIIACCAEPAFELVRDTPRVESDDIDVADVKS